MNSTTGAHSKIIMTREQPEPGTKSCNIIASEIKNPFKRDASGPEGCSHTSGMDWEFCIRQRSDYVTKVKDHRWAGNWITLEFEWTVQGCTLIYTLCISIIPGVAHSILLFLLRRVRLDLLFIALLFTIGTHCQMRSRATVTLMCLRN